MRSDTQKYKELPRGGKQKRFCTNRTTYIVWFKLSRKLKVISEKYKMAASNGTKYSTAIDLYCTF